MARRQRSPSPASAPIVSPWGRQRSGDGGFAMSPAKRPENGTHNFTRIRRRHASPASESTRGAVDAAVATR